MNQFIEVTPVSKGIKPAGKILLNLRHVSYIDDYGDGSAMFKRMGVGECDWLRVEESFEDIRNLMMAPKGTGLVLEER